MQGLVPLFKGFLAYGGISVHEMEAIAVNIEKTMVEDVISQGPIFIESMLKEVLKRNIPVVTLAGELFIVSINELKQIEEPNILRSFFGKLNAKSD